MPARGPLARLALRLEGAGLLGEEDRHALLGLRLQPRLVPPRADICAAPDAAATHLVLSGVACRYHVLSNGARSIVGLYFPGDLCGGRPASPALHPGALGALSPCLVADIPFRTLEVLIGEHPDIGRALSWLSLVELAITQRWLVNAAQEAERRIAHLICEISARAEAAGMCAGDAFAAGIRQGTIADVAAVSVVHVNRVLHALRDGGLIMLEKGVVRVPEPERLSGYAEFDPGYLHLAGGDRPGPRDAVFVPARAGLERTRA